MSAPINPIITIIIPSFNQGRYLEQALASIFAQNLPLEIFLMDGGSSDETLDVINRWKSKFAGWRSAMDGGQAASINEGVLQGSAPYVCWLNSDDWLLPGGLSRLLRALEMNPQAPFSYGYSWNFIENSRKKKPTWVEKFSEHRLAVRCIISQPATLIRRSAWGAVGGVNEALYMALDYDLWWRLYRECGPPVLVKKFIAVNRVHHDTKTNKNRALHYHEAIRVVKKYYGRLPLKWRIYKFYSVWFKSIKNILK